MTEELGNELPDLTNINLRKLFEDDDSNLGSALKRILDSLDDPDGAISAFQSMAGSWTPDPE